MQNMQFINIVFRTLAKYFLAKMVKRFKLKMIKCQHIIYIMQNYFVLLKNYFFLVQKYVFVFCATSIFAKKIRDRIPGSKTPTRYNLTQPIKSPFLRFGVWCFNRDI